MAPTLLLSLLMGCPSPGETGGKDSEPDKTWPTEPPVDADGDGWVSGDGDCDDADPAVHPSQEEQCNGVDDNCDGEVDEGVGDADADGTPDCLDLEDCDGIDNDGDGLADEDEPDADGDGVADCVEVEDCDGVDNDGNGVADDAADADGDGWGACEDCDDDDAAVSPGAAEADNDVDDDCDGAVDERAIGEGELRVTELLANPQYLPDPDGEWIELYNAGSESLDLVGLRVVVDGVEEVVDRSVELAPGAYVVLGGDMILGENGGVEIAWEWSGLSLQNEGGSIELWSEETLVDSVDFADPTVGAAWLLDPWWLDGAGEDWCVSVSEYGTAGDHGTPGSANESCWSLDHDGDGSAAADGDCDDADPAVGPGIPETWYDGVDSDCAGDDDDDQDHDGWTVDLDCDDVDAGANPGATEVCDEADVDEDCDGLADDADLVETPTAWYPDLDADGYGDAAAAVSICARPGPDWTDLAGDCDDATAEASPAGVEVCGDGLDNDCDGSPGSCGWSGETADADRDAYHAALAGTVRNEGAGASLAFAGDVDGDGVEEIVVGAPVSSGRGTGEVYVTPVMAGDNELGDEGWYYSGAGEDHFGSSVLGGVDLDGDGLADVAAGATANDDGGTDAGIVYIFAPDASRADDVDDVAVATIVGDGDAALGTALASLGDIDGDGFQDLAVSADMASDGLTGSGSVYLFHGPFVGEWSVDDAVAVLYGETASDHVGDDLDAGADLDGDGVLDLAIGAVDAGGTRPNGAVYVLSAASTGNIDLGSATAVITGSSVEEECGAAVRLVEDVDGDGYGDLWVGATADPGTGSAMGAVNLFHGPLAGELETDSADAVLYGEANQSRAGDALADLGDVDFDGRSDLAVGSPGWNTSAGGVYILYGGDWAGSLTLGDSDARFMAGSAETEFGAAVAGGVDLSGDGYADLLVGATALPLGATGAGGVFVFAGGPGY